MAIQPSAEADADPQSRAIRALAAQVIEQARSDVRSWRAGTLRQSSHRNTTQGGRPSLVEATQAWAFLTGDTPGWREALTAWCEILGFEPKTVSADAHRGCPVAVMSYLIVTAVDVPETDAIKE